MNTDTFLREHCDSISWGVALCISAAVPPCPLFPLQALSSSLWHLLHSPTTTTNTATSALEINKTLHQTTKAADTTLSANQQKYLFRYVVMITE